MRHLPILSAFIGSFFAVAFASTVAQVEADIDNLLAQTTSYNNAITAFPPTGGSLTTALVDTICRYPFLLLSTPLTGNSF